MSHTHCKLVHPFTRTRYTKALDAIKGLRKDRVSELKTDKERLESLKKEKSHADKVKTRISDLQSTIAKKEVQHEKLRADCDALAMANSKFYESATKFREQYKEMENQIDQKQSLEEKLRNDLPHVKEMSGEWLNWFCRLTINVPQRPTRS